MLENKLQVTCSKRNTCKLQTATIRIAPIAETFSANRPEIPLHSNTDTAFCRRHMIGLCMNTTVLQQHRNSCTEGVVCKKKKKKKNLCNVKQDMQT